MTIQEKNIVTKKFSCVGLSNFYKLNTELDKWKARHRKLGNAIILHNVYLENQFRNILGYEYQFWLTVKYSIKCPKKKRI